MDQYKPTKMKKKNKMKAKLKNNLTQTSLISGNSKVDETTSFRITKEKKIKLKKKFKNIDEGMEMDSNVEQSQETLLDQPTALKLTKKKKKKKRKVETESKEDNSTHEDCEKIEEPTKKKKKLPPIVDGEYYPGMLSDLIQIRNYGRVIIPWDPSFGLDKKYSVKPGNGEDDCSVPTLKITPLFDLSKRKPASLSDEAGGGSTFFVGNLPSGTRIMDLKKLFSKHGIIYKVKLKPTKFRTPGKSSENGNVATESETVNAIIKFKTLKSSEALLSMNGTLYKDHHLRVTLLKDDPNIEKERSVFVGNLAFSAHDDDLWKAFEDCGEIESVRIIRDGRSGKGKGFGYVNFKSAESVAAALELEGKLVLSRELRVMMNSNRAVSVSNQITVKRKNLHKKRKSLPKDKTEDKSHKTKKTSKKSCEETEVQSESVTSRETDSSGKKKIKKKKKKKKITNESTE